MQSAERSVAADRFTETMTLSFRDEARDPRPVESTVESTMREMREEYPLPKSGELTSIEVRGVRGNGRSVSISIVDPDSGRQIAWIAVQRGDVTFVDPGQGESRVEFAAGDVLVVSVHRDLDDSGYSFGVFLAEVTVQLSYRVAA